MHNLNDARKRIEVLDQKIIEALGERLKLCEEMGDFKKENALPIPDLAREAELQKLHQNWASQNALSPVFVTQLFELIFAEAKRVQE